MKEGISMLKKIIYVILLSAVSVFAQFTSVHTGEHVDSSVTAYDFAILQLEGQTIDGSVTAGEVCELTSSGWNEADASAESTADGVLGIYLGSNQVLLSGIYTTTGLTAGSLYWLSETEGQWTSTMPTATGTIVKFIGQAISTTKLVVFQNIWLERGSGGGEDTLHYTTVPLVIGLQDTIDALQSDIENILNIGDVRVPFMWAYLQLDTTGSVVSIDSVKDGAVSTLFTSDTFDVSTNDVVWVHVDSGKYKVKYKFESETATWIANWQTNANYYKGVDSAVVQFYTGASNSTAYEQVFYVSNDADTFLVTTVASGGDTLGAELITNGDMESNSEWVTYLAGTNYQSSTAPHGGTYSWYVSAVSGAGIYNSAVTLENGETYYIDFWVKVVTVGGNAKCNFISAEIVNEDYTDGSWVHVIASFVSDVTSSSIYFLSNGGAYEFYIDDVSLKKKLN